MATRDDSSAAEALKTLGSQLAKNFEKQPGWVYLLVTAYLATPLLPFPAQIPIFGQKMSISNEIWAVLLGSAAYWIGDGLDKITFKKLVKDGQRLVWRQRYEPEALSVAKQKARTSLGIHHGVYDVSMRLLEAAHDARFTVHLVNELTKFFRSLILPGVILFVVTCFRTFPLSIASVLSLIALRGGYLMAWDLYPRLKAVHIKNLYKMVPVLLAEKNDDRIKRLSIHGSGTFNIFFWDDLFVAAAKRALIPGSA